jgi:hypothetical protein
MDDVTIQAIKGSIAKWERILEAHDSREDHGTLDCPLCVLFFDDRGRCNNCPISDFTGEDMCRKTPYYKWELAVSKLFARGLEGDLLFFPGYYDTDDIPWGHFWSSDAELAANAEAQFLKGLLDMSSE